MAKHKYKITPDFKKRLKAITATRAKTVVDHILMHGFISTEELNSTYGYDHPPRAARDVREQGIPLETFKVTGSHGRKIGAYRFGDPAAIHAGKLGGRKAWPKKFKLELLELHGSLCAICFTEYEPRYLQIDHCVPYEVAGDDNADPDHDDFMLVCSSCNRAKSWSCEHCTNWTTQQNPKVCTTCYWANPTSYMHIALRQIRRLDITWTEEEVLDYDSLQKLSELQKEELPDFVKAVLRDYIGDS
ncbi:MAG: HNH endonuclease [Planctomycetota bacterium]|nr:HNH endonuclease [Planctomycetota bacterium]